MSSTSSEAMTARHAPGARQSLRVRLPLLISVLLVILVSTFLLAAYREVEATLIRAGSEHAASAADQVAGLLERASLAGLENLRRVTADAAVRRYAKNPSNETRVAARARLASLVTAGVRSVEVWSADGSRLVDTPIQPTANAPPIVLPPGAHAPTPGFNALQAVGNDVFAETVAEISDEPSPAGEAAGEAAPRVGYLVVRSMMSVSPPDALTRLVGGDAAIKLGNAAGSPWTDLSRIVTAPPADLMRNSVAEYRAADGERQVGRISKIRGTPWAVWVEFPRSTIVFPAQAFLRRMIIVAAVFIAVGVLLMGILSTRITQPIHELALAANAIAEGDYSRRVTTRRADEIGQLGRAFNIMAAQVQIAADALRSSQETFATTLSSIHDGVAVTDADGRLVYVNPMAERILGTGIVGTLPDEWAPRDHWAYETGIDVQHDDRPLYRALRGEDVRDVEVFRRNVRLPDGLHINVNAGPLRDSNGVPRGAWFTFRDVSLKRRLDAESLRATELELRGREAQRANGLKSEFLANMSHELRTPLNAIIGFAELMHRGKVGPVSAEHEEYLGDILTSSRHLLQLINDVLDLAKVESGKMEFRPEPIDLAKLAREVCDVLRGLAASRRLRVETEVDPEVAVVVVDPARVKQILYNYLSNAIKFTPSGGRITIRILPEGPALFRIDVEDTGVGIAADDMRKLFVEFQQLDASAAKEYQGTGLGLALTKKLAEAHGGRVAVRSTPGEGSTFSVILPRAMTRAMVDEVAGPITTPPAGNRTILVVDDDPAALKLANLALREMGYRPVCCIDPEDALRRAEADPPGIVIVDLLMPEVDGFEFVTRFRAMAASHDVPIIVWTVKDLDADDRRRLQPSITGLVSKNTGGSRALVEELQRLLPPGTPTSKGL